MKYILITATKLFIGEVNNDSETDIIGSISFLEEDEIKDENLEQFLINNNQKLLELITDLNEEIVSDNQVLNTYLRKIGYKNVRFTNTGEFATFRKTILDYCEKKYPTQKYDSIMRLKALEYTRSLLRDQVEARDIYIAQAINSIDDVNSILNLIYARLSEWYSIHFPELQDLVRDNSQYITLLAKTKGQTREEIQEDLLSHISEKRRSLILEAAQHSLGASISHFDMKPISELATFGVEILRIKDSLEKYIDESMKEVAPNIQCLVGSLLGARLIALVGSLENLAKSSSGTIQVLGAEKALFRHLKSGEDPPKHGVIFQSPFLHSAKKHQRGKIARALAGKLSIAARVDFFSGEFIGPTLLQDLEKRVNEIKATFPEPSERQLEQKRQKRQKPKKRGKQDRKRPYGKKSGKSKDFKKKG
ncbi:MAG: C/D box methylation guide ribonucleoprotein complex aNOP56 subunit [Candidatus Heimdallarchaeota archaeon]|nr:C/D box methylation guide ribonucleoprotein complex aNOP56 subunit [Candidatus Heimdallarchaeota archaeon]